MSTIIPYFDPILGKLRNSDVALISVATLIVSDPLIVNNLQVLSNASVNQLHTNSIYNVSTISTNGLGLNYAQWNSNTSLGPLEGLMNWSSLYGTIQLGLAGGNVDVPLGLTTNLPKRVRNSTGSTMPKGTAVYLNGVSGNTPLVERALATGDRTSAFTIGMTAEDIANNATGWVTSFGLIRGIDTSSFTSGDTLYLSGATAGYYTNVPTKTPVHYVRVGTVTKASADGEIIVNVINGYELDELHNVVISSLASGQILQSGASSYWYNRSLASAIAENISFLSLGSLAVMNQLSYASLIGKPSLGSLAEMNALSYGSILNLPSLGSLAQMNALSFTSLLNQPSLSSLAFQATIDYTSTQLTNKPSLGSLAQMNALSFTSLLNQPSLSSLAFQSTIDYTSNQLTNKPSLGSLAQMNQLSFTSLTNQPSLSSLAFQSTVDYVTQVTSKPSLGSLAPLNAVTQTYLPSSASFAILTTQGIVNASTVSTNLLYVNGVLASNASIGTFFALAGMFASTVSTNLLYSNNIYASTISVGNITGNALAITSTASVRTIRAVDGLFTSVVSVNNFYAIAITTSAINSTTINSSNLMNATGLTVTGTASINNLNVAGFVTGTNLTGVNKGDQYMPFWGDGADGTVTFDGSSSLNTNFCTYNSATLTYTLTRDVYAYDMYIAPGYTLITAGWRIFCYNSFNNTGIVHNNGFSASGASAGLGGLGGFFRAGGTGAAGLGTAATGVGNTVPLATANTFIGTLSGRGASARTAINAGIGSFIASASITVPTFGGKLLAGNYTTYQYPYIQANASIQTQPTFSYGGGGGSKSAVGTSAISGGGGGGGGVIYIASPALINTGQINSYGGTGGNAAGTGGIFGGGGGGAGGTVFIHTSTKNSLTNTLVGPNTGGGAGGNSAGTANTLAVGRSDSTFASTATTQYVQITPTTAVNYNSYYILAIHVQYTAGTFTGITSVSGYGLTWTKYADFTFNTIATPTRTLQVYVGIMNNYLADVVQDPKIYINFPSPVNAYRINFDEIQNTRQADYIDPQQQNAQSVTDSATTLATSLGVTPTTNNMQYTVWATSGGTAFTGGTGVTLLNNTGTTNPILVSGVAISRASSAITWTTAAAAAAFTMDLNQPSVQETGGSGITGKTYYYVS